MWGCISDAEPRNKEVGNKHECGESGNGVGENGQGVQLGREKGAAFCQMGTGFRERKEKLLQSPAWVVALFSLRLGQV